MCSFAKIRWKPRLSWARNAKQAPILWGQQQRWLGLAGGIPKLPSVCASHGVQFHCLHFCDQVAKWFFASVKCTWPVVPPILSPHEVDLRHLQCCVNNFNLGNVDMLFPQHRIKRQLWVSLEIVGISPCWSKPSSPSRPSSYHEPCALHNLCWYLIITITETL